ncbi:hypothetical protein K1719_016350 [Acacia pycnantha]|nr:hypothetical protein K1719_016350 [Acacia pycnantha]
MDSQYLSELLTLTQHQDLLNQRPLNVFNTVDPFSEEEIDTVQDVLAGHLLQHIDIKFTSHFLAGSECQIEEMMPVGIP